MSNDKNPEVVGCDASIMRNVWEIRERDYEQKLQLEQERIEKSALPSINEDWANRLLIRTGKKIERKPKPDESQVDNKNIWKSKKPQIRPAATQVDDNNVWKDTQFQTPPASRGAGSGPMGRPGNQGRGFSTPGPNVKDKKEQYKKVDRLQLLMFITQTQPSPMMWGKAWKYNKSLPSSSESNTTNWGQCWMFATQQPYSEEGKPWPSEPNMMDPHNLDLWKKTDYRVVESKDLDLCLPSEEWQMSWRRHDKKNKGTSENEENAPNYGFFTSMVESQRHNEALCSSEWRESWKATKPADKQHCFTVPNDVIMNESIAKKQDNNREMSLEWEESWKFVNHYDCNKSKSPQIQKSCSPEWANAWRAATVVSNNHKNSDATVRKDHSDSYSDWDQQKESHLHNVLYASHEQKYRAQHLHLSNEFKNLSEWNMSWKVTKNTSKPCEEMEKILKELQSNMKNQKMEENPNRQYSTSEKMDPCYEQLKHTVIYHPKREFTHSKLLLQKHEEKKWSVSEWRESWKTLKHRMRMERRRMRPDPSRPFRESEKGGDGKPQASEWKNSWKFTCQSLHQEPEFWQQGWTSTPQIRVDRVRDWHHFAPVEVPKNGPVVERSYGESWRFSRNQERSQSGQGKARTSASHTYQRYNRTSHVSASDWQEAWMVSETQFHHDRPSLTQWMEAWRSASHTEHWSEQVSRDNCMDKLMEIQSQKAQRAKAKMSYYFENLMFSKSYPEKEWSTSWRAGSSLTYQPSHHGSSGSNTTRQQHTTTNGHGSKWGMSFRLANPMPRVEQPWVESSPNPCYYAVMWSREKNKKYNINTSFSTNFDNIMLWAQSPQFLQGKQIKGKSKSNEPVDPRVIMTRKTKTRKHMYSNLEEKQDKKWAGCHLLGKTQPRAKKGSASGKKIKLEEETNDKFFEDWGESWRFLDQPNGPKKQMIIMKTPSGWDESWKFLFPPYQPLNGPKVK